MNRDLSVPRAVRPPVFTPPPGVGDAVRAFFQHPDAAEALHFLVMERCALPLTEDEAERFDVVRPLLTAPVLVALDRAEVLTYAIEAFARHRGHFGVNRLRTELTRPDVREGLFLMAKHPIVGLSNAEAFRMEEVREKIEQGRNAELTFFDSESFS